LRIAPKNIGRRGRENEEEEEEEEEELASAHELQQNEKNAIIRHPFTHLAMD
jgi:hypothetical protein